ncbi:MAG: hypothetical protein JWR69_3654 [Pedosphaera sp.]|nr:hypothetical protein [Pedosphaera sp.]
MQEYQIRILDENDVPYIGSTHKLFSTHAALGSALRMARGKPFEIWSGGRCLYASNPVARTPQPPGLAA